MRPHRRSTGKFSIVKRGREAHTQIGLTRIKEVNNTVIDLRRSQIAQVRMPRITKR